MGLGLGTFLGAGLKVGGAIAGLISGNKDYKRQKAMLDQQDSENTAWYNRRYNEVGTERGTAQKALTAMRDAQQARMAKASGTAAVIGASGETAASEKQAANKAIGETISTINAGDDARKDKIESQYRTQKAAIDENKQKLQANKRAQIQSATSQIGSIGSQLIASDEGGSIGNIFKNNKQARTVATIKGADNTPDETVSDYNPPLPGETMEEYFARTKKA